MRWSQTFIPTIKETPKEAEAISHGLMLRAGLVHMLTSGVYSYLPLGLRVLRNIENIIREEMNAIGAQECFLPCLHPIDLWKKTGRDEVLDEVMIKFEDNRGRAMCLGPTHEEVITNLVQNYVQSYKQLPIVLYQIQTKFRDELRTRFGVVRACEFIMKDAYSFDVDKESLQKNYDLMLEAYKKIFKRCGLDVIIKEADSGAMGGDVSHEFLVPAEIGEDKIEIEVDGKKQETTAIELGHIFQLGTKYSQAQKALFVDEDGKQNPIIMGCYGIGVSRIIAAIIEKNNDANGIIWPKEIAPYDVEIVPLSGKEKNELIEAEVESLKEQLEGKGLNVLVDDRDESPGRKFNDADLIGIPTRVILGKQFLNEGTYEIKSRSEESAKSVTKDQAVETLVSV